MQSDPLFPSLSSYVSSFVSIPFIGVNALSLEKRQQKVDLDIGRQEEDHHIFSSLAVSSALKENMREYIFKNSIEQQKGKRKTLAVEETGGENNG